MTTFLGVDGDLDLVDVVLNRWRGGRREIAALSRPVVEAAGAGDAVARVVLADAATELARVVEATRARLGFLPHETVPVSYSGGMFSVTEIRNGFRERLSDGGGLFALQVPRNAPMVGAALYAAQLTGAPLGPRALARLRDTCREATEG